MKLQSIQALRSIAALMVVLVHAASFERKLMADNLASETPLIGGLFLNGYGGVDLFFVISGFIMVWVTHPRPHGTVESLGFLFARITRIYPVWWFAAGLMVLYALNLQPIMALSTGEISDERFSYSADYLVRSFLLLPQGEYPVLAIGWTLIHEVYFYVVFALLMLLPRHFLPWAMLVWGTGVIAASFAGITHHEAVNFVTLIVHPMTMEFIFGAVVGLMVTSGVTWRGGIVTLLAALWLTAAFCLQGPADAFTLSWGRVILFGLPCAALVYGVAALEAEGRLAWLIPSAAGAIVTGALFQFYAIAPDAPITVRAQAVVLPLIAGLLSALAVLWAGWLGGQHRPGAVLWIGGGFRRLFAGLARTGDWSYSVYLIHLFVLGMLHWIFGRLGQFDALAPVFRVGHPGPLDNLAFLACGLVGVLLAGWVTHHLVERPSLFLAARARTALFGPRMQTAAGG